MDIFGCTFLQRVNSTQSIECVDWLGIFAEKEKKLRFVGGKVTLKFQFPNNFFFTV